jgi:hypothetical protein
MITPHARRRPDKGAIPVLTAKFGPGERTPTERQFAITEATVRAKAIETVVCHDLVHGRGLDDETALWVATMAGQALGWLELAGGAA